MISGLIKIVLTLTLLQLITFCKSRNSSQVLSSQKSTGIFAGQDFVLKKDFLRPVGFDSDSIEDGDNCKVAIVPEVLNKDFQFDAQKIYRPRSFDVSFPVKDRIPELSGETLTMVLSFDLQLDKLYGVGFNIEMKFDEDLKKLASKITIRDDDITPVAIMFSENQKSDKTIVLTSDMSETREFLERLRTKIQKYCPSIFIGKTS